MVKYTLAWNDEVSTDTLTGCALFAMVAAVIALLAMIGWLCPGGASGTCSTSVTCFVGAMAIACVVAIIIGVIACCILCVLAGLCVAKLDEKPMLREKVT